VRDRSAKKKETRTKNNGSQGGGRGKFLSTERQMSTLAKGRYLQRIGRRDAGMFRIGKELAQEEGLEGLSWQPGMRKMAGENQTPKLRNSFQLRGGVATSSLLGKGGKGGLTWGASTLA